MGWEVALTAVVTAAVTWSVVQRQITAQYVMKERRKWREEIRARALLVHDAILRDKHRKLCRLKAELMAQLNPLDEEDRKLLECMEAGSESSAQEFAERVALLLKHDWERAKLEASTFRRLWFKDVKRETWKCWKGRSHLKRPRWRRVKAWCVRIRWIGPIPVLLGIAWGIAAFAPHFWIHMKAFWSLIAS